MTFDATTNTWSWFSFGGEQSFGRNNHLVCALPPGTGVIGAVTTEAIGYPDMGGNDGPVASPDKSLVAW